MFEVSSGGTFFNRMKTFGNSRLVPSTSCVMELKSVTNSSHKLILIVSQNIANYSNPLLEMLCNVHDLHDAIAEGF